jgi:hypothetical protein
MPSTSISICGPASLRMMRNQSCCDLKKIHSSSDWRDSTNGKWANRIMGFWCRQMASILSGKDTPAIFDRPKWRVFTSTGFPTNKKGESTERNGDACMLSWVRIIAPHLHILRSLKENPYSTNPTCFPSLFNTTNLFSISTNSVDICKTILGTQQTKTLQSCRNSPALFQILHTSSR